MPEIDHTAIAAYGQLSLTILTALVAILVYRTTRNLGKINYLRDLNGQWLQINLLLISDRSSWEIWSKFIREENEINENNFKKDQITALFMNMAEQYYRGMMLGHVERGLAENYIDHVAFFFRNNKERAGKILGTTYRTDFGKYMQEKIDRI
ncbi:MAG: hypothetical protein AAF950_18330 [Pseudomonadota bacterium]